MEANNSYCFCYRNIENTNQLSIHSIGKAIDINPYFNPLIWKYPFEKNANIPKNAGYSRKKSGTFYLDHPVVQVFLEKGFSWGYFLEKYHDYHHFYK